MCIRDRSSSPAVALATSSGRPGRTNLTHALRVAHASPPLGMCISAMWQGCARRWLPPVSANRA
eukprot:4132586-Pyramimonas_sp.AAC.1